MDFAQNVYIIDLFYARLYYDLSYPRFTNDKMRRCDNATMRQLRRPIRRCRLIVYANQWVIVNAIKWIYLACVWLTTEDDQRPNKVSLQAFVVDRNIANYGAIYRMMTFTLSEIQAAATVE